MNKLKAKLLNSKLAPNNIAKTYEKTCRSIGDCHSREEEQIIVDEWATNLQTMLDIPNLNYNDFFRQ